MGEQADPPGGGHRRREIADAHQPGEECESDESIESGPSGMTLVPRQVQRAAARLADSGQDVYHARVRLDPAAAERDRRALVTGLEDSQTALELLETGSDDPDVLEFVTAPRFGIETVVDAIERCSFVDEVTDRRLLATPGSADGDHGLAERAEGATWNDGSKPSPSSSERGEAAGPFTLPDDEVSHSEIVGQARATTAEETETAPEAGADDGADDRSFRRRGDADPEVNDRHSAAIDARVTRLESRFAQFDAYVEELETLLDRQSAYQRRVGRVDEALGDLEASVETLDVESDRHRRKIVAVRDAVEAAARERDDLADALDDVRDRQEAIADDVGSLRSWRERLSEALGATTD